MIRILGKLAYAYLKLSGDEPFAFYSIGLILLESDEASLLQFAIVDYMVCLYIPFSRLPAKRESLDLRVASILCTKF
jgi:hypothetical protein